MVSVPWRQRVAPLAAAATASAAGAAGAATIRLPQPRSDSLACKRWGSDLPEKRAPTQKARLQKTAVAAAAAAAWLAGPLQVTRCARGGPAPRREEGSTGG